MRALALVPGDLPGVQGRELRVERLRVGGLVVWDLRFPGWWFGVLGLRVDG